MVDDATMSGRRSWNTMLGSVQKFFNRRSKKGRTPVGESTEYSSLANAQLPDAPAKNGLLYDSAKLGWRPTKIKPLFLISFAVLTAILVILLEVMLRKSQSYGALAFVTDRTTFVDHCFSFLPLLLGIFYGLLYASVDHDLKRLEAYFQLSNPKGVTADNSLLLEYPYLMAITVPYVSFRKR